MKISGGTYDDIRAIALRLHKEIGKFRLGLSYEDVQQEVAVEFLSLKLSEDNQHLFQNIRLLYSAIRQKVVGKLPRNYMPVTARKFNPNLSDDTKQKFYNAAQQSQSIDQSETLELSHPEMHNRNPVERQITSIKVHEAIQDIWDLAPITAQRVFTDVDHPALIELPDGQKAGNYKHPRKLLRKRVKHEAVTLANHFGKKHQLTQQQKAAIQTIVQSIFDGWYGSRKTLTRERQSA